LIELEQDSPNQPTWQTIVHLLVGLLIVYVAARPVIHALHRHFFLESDSVAYIGLGTNLWHGRGFTDFAGNWCSDWPPLYPFFIGLSELLARNEVLAVGIVGGLCFAATILFAYIWLGRLTRSLFVRVVVTVMLALSVPLTNLANSGLSEILFVPLSVASMYFTAAYLDRGLRRNLLLSAFIALLCCLARYIGIAMIAAALIAILISPKQTIKRRLSDSGIFLIISVVPFAGWCAINHWINGDWMGQRIPGDFPRMLDRADNLPSKHAGAGLLFHYSGIRFTGRPGFPGNHEKEGLSSVSKRRLVLCRLLRVASRMVVGNLQY